MATPTARRYVEELKTHRSPEEEEKVRRYFKHGGEARPAHEVCDSLLGSY